ncbi:MAG: NAD(P)H-dependent oxidoreductase [Planctomycetes bacterium]|nr:NAD(P)H-dependent oxidoreductase [Planctomycetota bacterium]
MAKILIAYYSRSGNTKKLAEAVRQGAAAVAGAEVICKAVGDVQAKDLLDYDGIMIGSPVYYGSMAWEVKKLFDESVAFHGKLSGKVGGAFSTSANLAGGNETTILDILNAMLIHGMVIRGCATGDHYGAVGINDPDKRATDQGAMFGKLVAELAVKLHG